jgi:predicted Zn-dependent peptidase
MKKIRSELMPGVFLTVLATDKFRTNCLSVNLLRPLSPAEAGYNALLPDVLLRGCRLCPDMGAISAWLDQRYGAGIQSLVVKKGEVQDVGFWLDYIDEKFAGPEEDLTADMCQALGSFLLEPVTENGVFRRDYVDGEKVNLINEIMSQINDKRIYAATRLRQEMFRDEAYGVSKNGEKAQVEAITLEDLYAHYRRVLAHSQIEIVFAGRADSDHLKACLLEALKDLPRGDIDPVETVLGPMPQAVRELSETMDITQGNLVMGFRTGVTAADPDYPAMVLLNTVFGGGITSKLFTHVRERLSLCYYASSGLNKFKGIMTVSSGVDMDKYVMARDEILRQLDLCRAGDITSEELESARSALLSSLRASEDSLSLMVDSALSQEIGKYDYTPEDLAQALTQVTVEDVQQAAKKVQLDTIFFLKGAE